MASYGKRKNDAVEDESGFKKTKTNQNSISLEELQQLLDFTTSITNSSVQSRFNAIAQALLHDFLIVVRCDSSDTFFEILELECYLHKAGCHEDPFTHGSEEQKISGRWYFHRAPKRCLDSSRSATSMTGYRGGTRKGLDLTFGPPLKLSHTSYSPHCVSAKSVDSSDSFPDHPFLRGGVLLRSIRHVTDGTVVSGPSLLVDEILKYSKAINISELVTNKWQGDTSAFFCCGDHSSTETCLFLQSRDATLWTASRPKVYSSPRIGIDLSHPGTTTLISHPRVRYLPKPYRYFTSPHLLTANGRAQTFLGVMLDILNSGMSLESKDLDTRIAHVMGLKSTSVQKYLRDYRSGLGQGSLKAFVGPSGKGASSSPSTYLRMMGILEKLKNIQM